MLVHSKVLRWLARPLIPTGWIPGNFKTSGAIDVQRVRLEILGSRMFRLKIVSFVCKIVSVATLFFSAGDTIGPSERSIIFAMTLLTVQAVPIALTLLLFYRHLFSRDGQSGTTPMISASEQELSDSFGAPMTESSVSDAPLQRPDVAAVEGGACQASTRNHSSFYSCQPDAIIHEKVDDSSAKVGIAVPVAARVAGSLPLADAQQSDSAAEGVGVRWMKGLRRYFSSRGNQSGATPLLHPM